MTVYENLQELKEKGMLMPAIRNGIISSTFLDYLDIYETYLDIRKDGETKMQSYHRTAAHHFISSENVRKIVSRMRS